MPSLAANRSQSNTYSVQRASANLNAGEIALPQLIADTRITYVWRALGGGKIRPGRGQAFWRKGDGWSVSLRDDRGCWYDHRDGIGGGVLDLIQHVRGGSRFDALRWLADSRCVTLHNESATKQDRRRYAQARRDAPALARAAALWHTERCGELDELKQEALERDDTPALIAAAPEHHLLSSLVPEGIIRAYLDARRKWPEHTAALVANGERWAQASEAAVASLIAQWAHDAADIERWETDGGAR
jgi:hypothetical protein